jgi:hypothetical protein
MGALFRERERWQPQGPLSNSMPQKEFRQASGDISFKSHLSEMPAQFEFTLPSTRISTPHSRQAQVKAMAEAPRFDDSRT